MKQILTRLLIFVICCIMCIHTFSISTHSVIYILLAIILAFGTILIADRLSPAALALIHAGIFILCCMIPELVVFLSLFCFYLSRRPGLLYCSHRDPCYHSGYNKIFCRNTSFNMCSLSVQHVIRISDHRARHPSSTDEAPYRYIGDK